MPEWSCLSHQFFQPVKQKEPSLSDSYFFFTSLSLRFNMTGKATSRVCYFNLQTTWIKIFSSKTFYAYQENILYPDSQDPECSETKYVFTLNIGLGPMHDLLLGIETGWSGLVKVYGKQENTWEENTYSLITFPILQKLWVEFIL